MSREQKRIEPPGTLLAGYMAERTEMRNSELWSMKMGARRALFQPPTAPSLGGEMVLKRSLLCNTVDARHRTRKGVLAVSSKPEATTLMNS